MARYYVLPLRDGGAITAHQSALWLGSRLVKYRPTGCVLVSQRDTLDIGVGAWTANLSGDPVYLSD